MKCAGYGRDGSPERFRVICFWLAGDPGCAERDRASCSFCCLVWSVDVGPYGVRVSGAFADGAQK